MTTTYNRLDAFYESLKSGLTIEVFLSSYEPIFEFVHSNGLTEDYRLARKRVKKLSDEVVPIARFCAKYAAPQDSIRFNLDEKYPDCIVARLSGEVWEIEVTIAQARERRALMTELNETGCGRGFIGLTDDQPKERFEDVVALESRAYSTEEAIQRIEHAIGLCAERKKLHSGDILLIEAPLNILPTRRWIESSAKFTQKVKKLQFCQIYLTGPGRGQDDDIVLKIK